MNMQSMSRPRRVETRWPQTQVMRRAHRTTDNPHRRSRPTWGELLDRLCWVVVVLGSFALAAFVLGYTVHRLNGLWS